MLVFYSPSGIHSLFKNFPKFKQNNTRIAGFGPTTQKAISKKKTYFRYRGPLLSAPSW